MSAGSPHRHQAGSRQPDTAGRQACRPACCSFIFRKCLLCLAGCSERIFPRLACRPPLYTMELQAGRVHPDPDWATHPPPSQPSNRHKKLNLHPSLPPADCAARLWLPVLLEHPASQPAATCLPRCRARHLPAAARNTPHSSHHRRTPASAASAAAANTVCTV